MARRRDDLVERNRQVFTKVTTLSIIFAIRWEIRLFEAVPCFVDMHEDGRSLPSEVFIKLRRRWEVPITLDASSSFDLVDVDPVDVERVQVFARSHRLTVFSVDEHTRVVCLRGPLGELTKWFPSSGLPACHPLSGVIRSVYRLGDPC